MPEIRYNKNHHAGPDAKARIDGRGKNSGPGADLTIPGDSGARFHNIHYSAGHVPVRDVRNVNIRDASKQKAPR